MQVRLTLRGAQEHDVEINADDQITAAQLASHFQIFQEDPKPVVLSVQGRPLPAGALLGGPGLRNGCIVQLQGSGLRPRLGSSILELQVISGPDAGRCCPLSRGEYVIGRGPDADIRVADADMSRSHAVIRVDSGGLSIRDLKSTNGTLVDGVQVSSPTPIAVGALLNLGQSMLIVASASEPPAAVRAGSDGSVLVNRPPRFATPVDSTAVEFPESPRPLSKPAQQWLANLLPAVLGIGLAVLLHNIQFLAFALLSPASILASSLADRRSARLGRRLSNAEFVRADTDAQRRATLRLEEETAARRRSHPHPAAIARMAATPDCRLWERRPADEDFLTVRVASADLPSRTRLNRGAVAMQSPVLSFVPVTVSLAAGALGITGPNTYTRGLAGWVVGQLLCLHSPADLSIIVLLDDLGAQWRWLRWTQAKIATSLSGCQEQLDTALALLQSRRQSRHPGTQSWLGPWTVIVIDPAQVAAQLNGIKTILQDGPSVGITALLIAPDVRLLPRDCRAVAAVSSATGDQIDLVVSGQVTVRRARAERVCSAWAEQLSRDLSPLRDATVDTAAAIPAEVGLIDLLGLDEISPASLIGRWSDGSEPASVIGMSASGPVTVNLLRDGPHALIAGSTGSGKSELLRSLVAGLATTSAPDDLSFILIDYKGGAAFAECVELPHTVAMITDLDPHLTRRALSSLNAELRRREAAFAAAGVTDLRTYRSHARHHPKPVARLIIIVDEFASLAEEFPDFISGLIGIAQRGRSLGVHLILATQRPSGVVSPEIKTNMALRIVLRVTDPSDSSDVIGSPAASALDKRTPGRAFAQLADGLVEFQTARIGLPLAPSDPIRVVRLDEWNKHIAAETPLCGPEDLRVLVDAAKAASEIRGVPRAISPWLAPLPNSVTSDYCASTSAQPADDAPLAMVIQLGLIDDPAQQRQFALTHDLSQGGSLGFIGGPRSGKTTALRTTAAVAAKNLGLGALQLYVLDCAGGSLLALAKLRVCATALGEGEPAAMARLLTRLSDELSERQRSLAAQGLSDSREVRAHGIDMPAVLLLLDGWEGFAALSEVLDAGRSIDILLRIMRDGPAAGFTVMITGDRGLLGLRVSAALQRKFVLALTDRNDYAAAGLSMRAVPSEMGPGRAVCQQDGLELQLATLTGEATFAAEWAAIEAIGQHCFAVAYSSRTPGSIAAEVGRDSRSHQPIRIRPLPRQVRMSELTKVVQGNAGPTSAGPDSNTDGPAEVPGRVLLGVGGDEALPVVIDVLDGDGRFLIAGPSRSGRSTAAIHIARQLHAKDVPLIVAAPQRSPLTEWAQRRGLEVLRPNDERPATLQGQLLIVDDAEAFTDTPVGLDLLTLMSTSSIAVVACARADELMMSFRGIAVVVKRNRIGLLLQPTAADGELLGLNLAGHRPVGFAGRGLLINDKLRAELPAGVPIQLAY